MTIEHHASINQPDFTNKDDCLVIYSLENITIKPRQDTYLDLKFNVDFKMRIQNDGIIRGRIRRMGLKQNKKQYNPTAFIE